MNGSDEKIDGSSISILLVDDLPEKRLVYEAVLEGLGPTVVSVSTGAEALKQILKHDFAVILLDVNMPGMDGFETARLIRQRKRSSSTPIIFLTAFPDEVRMAQGYASGAVDYLPTPVVPEILRAKIRVFVDLFQMRRLTAQQAEEKAKQTATEEANRRLTFLADASAVLGRSLDIQTTSRGIVRVPVPMLADVCVLTLRLTAGETERMLYSSTGEESQTAVQIHEYLNSCSMDANFAIDRVMEGAEYELIDGKTGLVLPLQARGRTFATLALFFNSSKRIFDANEIALAEAFSSRAAMALDNALLHEEIRSADRQKNEFLSMLAHELRNPLAPIRNAAQLLTLKIPQASELKWECDVINRQIAQMVRLVDDLLDVARITRDKIRLHRQPIELATIIEQAAEASRPEIDSRGHHLQVVLPRSVIWIDGDLTRLTQVFTNLINNAAKFTPHEGQIRLTASQEGDSAIIRVKDNGIGIPPSMLESVFKLFTQVDRALERSQGGLGIGLTLVKRLVEMHDGSVIATSDGQGRGSEFIVRLPLIPQSTSNQTTEPDVNGKNQKLNSRRILVVDDNQDSVRTLSMILRMMGHETDVASDGLQAVEAAAAYRPDTILLDIGLPKLNGYEVCRHVREQPGGNSILIIALTGWGQNDDRTKSTDAGFDHHLVKPIDLSSLEQLLAIQNS